MEKNQTLKTIVYTKNSGLPTYVRRYRFSFNGQEKDDEVSGAGNTMTAEFWEYDSRLGRRWNIDPLIKVRESPYATFGNNPIMTIDPLGLSVEDPQQYKVHKGNTLSQIAKDNKTTIKDYET